MLRKTAFCILIAFVAVYAQVALIDSRAVPELLNYQGYLTDTLGIPIDDKLDMTFKIFDAATVGNELWVELSIWCFGFPLKGEWVLLMAFEALEQRIEQLERR